MGAHQAATGIQGQLAGPPGYADELPPPIRLVVKRRLATRRSGSALASPSRPDLPSRAPSRPYRQPASASGQSALPLALPARRTMPAPVPSTIQASPGRSDPPPQLRAAATPAKPTSPASASTQPRLAPPDRLAPPSPASGCAVPAPAAPRRIDGPRQVLELASPSPPDLPSRAPSQSCRSGPYPCPA